MKPLLPLLMLILILCLNTKAQAPQGYYDPASGLYGAGLQQALHDIIDNHNTLSYDELWSAFQSTDKKTNGKVWDIYSDIPGGTPPYQFTFGSDQCGSYNGEGDCYNREHSWPRSWFNDQSPMDSDLFHLYPTDGYVNNKRSNHPYGKVGSASWTSDNGSKVGDCSTTGYSGTVFEPIDAYKGDLARTYFYMATRYYKEDNGWPGSGMTSGSQLKPWAVTMLLEWHQADPVSEKEINRNNAAYLLQQNRNPFIDHPEYAQNIWGTNAVMENGRNHNLLKISPVPCSSNCTITLPYAASKHNVSLLVYSPGGQLISTSYRVEDDRIIADVSHLQPGIYLACVRDHISGEIYHCKIVMN
jgi:endonuclease I